MRKMWLALPVLVLSAVRTVAMVPEQPAGPVGAASILEILHPGWPQILSNVLPGSPNSLVIDQNSTAADLDGDGRVEWLVAQGKAVQVFRDDGSSAPGWPRILEVNGIQTRTQRSPAAADLDGDGRLELVVPTNSSHLLIFNADGTQRIANPQLLAHEAAVGNVTGDARPEIATTSSFLGRVWLLDNEGRPLPGWPWKPTGSGPFDFSPPALADLDRDGKVEMIFTESVGALRLYVLRGDASAQPGFPLTLAPAPPQRRLNYFYPTVGDVDGNGTLEIVTGTSTDEVFVVANDGRMLPGWPRRLPDLLSQNGPASLADLDDDGAAEIVLGGVTRSGFDVAILYALDGWGRVLPGWPVRWGADEFDFVTYYGYGTAALADVDGDGVRDVVVDRGDAPDTGARALSAYSRSGAEITGSPFSTDTGGPSPLSTPAVLDFDHDGRQELGWVNNDGKMFLWDLDAPATGSAGDWPMVRHDPAHTGTQPAKVQGCVPSDTVLCLDDQPGDRRFQIQVAFETVQAGGRIGRGHAIPLSSLGVARGGLFWFFSADNPELLIKLLNGCGVNNRRWLFYSAGTNVRLSIVVTDMVTGRQAFYSNPDQTPAPPVQDTSALICQPRAAAAVVPAPVLPAQAPRPEPPRETVSAEGGCTPGDTVLCLDNSPGDRRFQVEVSYSTAAGFSGAGHAIPLASLGISRGGLFWFFGPDNPEMLIKVLDGCALSGHRWVFYSAGTNVGFRVTVTDTVTGESKVYENRDGTAAPPVQDIRAFSCSADEAARRESPGILFLGLH